MVVYASLLTMRCCPLSRFGVMLEPSTRKFWNEAPYKQKNEGGKGSHFDGLDAW